MPIVLSLFETIFLSFIKQVCLGTSQIHNFRTAISLEKKGNEQLIQEQLKTDVKAQGHRKLDRLAKTLNLESLDRRKWHFQSLLFIFCFKFKYFTAIVFNSINFGGPKAISPPLIKYWVGGGMASCTPVKAFNCQQHTSFSCTVHSLQ